jgi:hypothetical protein
MVAATLWAFLRPDYAGGNLAHLGYPPYVQSIVGVWAFPCALALVFAGFGQLKEWAYAGAVFDYSGAVASHVLLGDGPSKWAAPLVFCVLALASRALLPGERCNLPSPGAERRPRAWLLSAVVVTLLVIVALLTLPGKNERLAARAPVRGGRDRIPESCARKRAVCAAGSRGARVHAPPRSCRSSGHEAEADLNRRAPVL